MNAVFADTFFFLAAVNSDDSAHRRAIEFSNEYQGPLVTTTWVLTEVADALSHGRNRLIFKALYEAIRDDRRISIVPPDEGLFSSGMRLYMERADKNWSLTDCISFVVMQERGIIEAATGDHHFAQAGFRALL